jgi:hypothetical protein
MDNALLIATMSATGYVIIQFLTTALQPFLMLEAML